MAKLRKEHQLQLQSEQTIQFEITMKNDEKNSEDAGSDDEVQIIPYIKPVKPPPLFIDLVGDDEDEPGEKFKEDTTNNLVPCCRRSGRRNSLLTKQKDSKTATEQSSSFYKPIGGVKSAAPLIDLVETDKDDDALWQSTKTRTFKKVFDLRRGRTIHVREKMDSKESVKKLTSGNISSPSSTVSKEIASSNPFYKPITGVKSSASLIDVVETDKDDDAVWQSTKSMTAKKVFALRGRTIYVREKTDSKKSAEKLTSGNVQIGRNPAPPPLINLVAEDEMNIRRPM